MRAVWLVAIAAFGCKKESSPPPGPSGADADALWDLAPDDTEVGWVATPKALRLVERGAITLRKLAADPELARLTPQIDAAFAEIGNPASLADIGLDHDKGLAMFGSPSGAVFVLPVGNRDKFVAAMHGTRGADADTIRDMTCKQASGVYACASSDALFAHLGKGHLRGKVAAAGGRGDAEVYAANVPLGKKSRVDVALAFEVEPGQLAVRGSIKGASTRDLGLVVAGGAKPEVDPDRTSGFGVISVGRMPPAPPGSVTPLVTIESLLKSIKGPITASVAAGTIDLQVKVPLSDPAPMAGVIEACPTLTFLPLAAQQKPGACRLAIPNAFEVDAWVDGKNLRFGANKGAPAEGKSVPMTAWAKDVANNEWTVALWGRGTVVAPALAQLPLGLPEEAKLLLRGLLYLNELGVAIWLDDDFIRFRAIARTAWANPDDVIAKLAAITGDDIAQGKAGDRAKAIAAAAPGSPFAADFEAGQGGLTIPTAAFGTIAAVAIPAFTSYMNRAKSSVPTTPVQ
jgi:hypothetical protein